MNGSLFEMTKSMFYEVITPRPAMKAGKMLKRMKLKGDIKNVITKVREFTRKN